MADTFRSKLSTTRAGERTRIWIEGKRLAAVGFEHGAKVKRKWTPATLTLELISDAEFEKLPHAERGTVSGRRDNPIIDVTGQKVAETFGGGTHVTISFEWGWVTIRRG